jgi:lipopolysaccharide biosynthesis glycosyltransferase
MPIMNILVATDKNYLPYTYTMLVSLLENNRGNRVNLFYISYDIDDMSIDRFKRFFAPYNVIITFLKYDRSPIAGLKTGFHFSHAMYLRIVSPDIIPETVNRILYLDSDTIVMKSLTDVYNTDLDGRFIGAVVNGNHKMKENAPDEHAYFYSGVMLIDLDKFRSNDISGRVLDYASRHYDNLVWPDQDALNAILYDKCLALHPRWNIQSSMINGSTGMSGLPSGEILEAISEPGIIHYEGTGKPWQPFCSHPYKDLFWHYVRQTPYRYSIRLQYWCRYGIWKPKNIGASLLRRLVSCLPKRLAQRLVPGALGKRLGIAF